MEPLQIRLSIPDRIDPSLLTGPEDKLLRFIESSFHAVITVRGSYITIVGQYDEVELISRLFSRLIEQLEAGDRLDVADIAWLLDRLRAGKASDTTNSALLLMNAQGRPIRPKTEGQLRYVESIQANTITFGLGPAGTGKTYLAMALAIAALKRQEVRRIVLARPVVEAGESLGFLPGTLEEKLDPYVRPLYDAFFDMVDREQGQALLERGVIEIAPLAFMRGRTFNDAFVILDEAQNTTPQQMKMFLTRLGFNSTFVVTGDESQRDLGGLSGLTSAEELLKSIPEIGFVHLSSDDIVRHQLVAKIVSAYERSIDA